MSQPVPFDVWMKECRRIGEERGCVIPQDMDEDAQFNWKNQYENGMMPSEAVYYYQQTLGENG